MKNTCLLSEDSKNYLCCFYQILDGMVQGMTTAGLTRSISHNFVAQMVPHHRGAIQMASNVLRFTEDPAVRRLAQRIAQERAQAIDRMEDTLDPGGRLLNSQMDLRLYQRRTDLIYRDMYAKMGRGPEHNRLAAVYLRQMVPHCLGAAGMAETALKYDVCTELVPVLRSTAVQQRRQAARMRALLGRMEGGGGSACFL